jgi:hypothetical protein
MNHTDLTLICEMSILFNEAPTTHQGSTYSWDFLRGSKIEMIEVDTETKEIRLVDNTKMMGMKYRTLQGIALAAEYTIGDYFTE